MTDSDRRTWDEAFTALRNAANELRTAVGKLASPGPEETDDQRQLRNDVSQLEQSIGALLTKLGQEFDARRPGIEASIDRERAANSAEQLKVSLAELSSQARRLSVEIGTAATDTMRQAEPELNAAIRDLDGLMSAASAWVRGTIDSPRERQGGPSSQGKPPLDDL